jgi:DnaK suppressor protein
MIEWTHEQNILNYPKQRTKLMETQSKKIKKQLDDVAGEYMNEEQVSILKAALIEERDELLQQQKNSMLESQEIGRPHMPDSVDIGSRETQEALDSANDRRRVKRLRQIGTALRNIETGDYGYCHKCGDEIGVARLSGNPAATHDIECATIMEKTT